MNLLRGAWQFLTAPRFAVEIKLDRGASQLVTAGEKTKVCAVSISLDYNGQLERGNYVRPLANYYQGKVYVTYENERLVNGKLLLDMFVYVTVAGTYTISPEFPPDSYVKFKRTDKSVRLNVKPSNTCYILLKKYVNSNPVEDEYREEFVSSYRGDAVRIYLDVIDEFQNKYRERLDFGIVSHNQSINEVQSTYRDGCSGWYVISVRYHKVGATTIHLSLCKEARLNAQILDQKVNVLTPPVSAANSYITQNDIDEIQERVHEAGQAITFKLRLVDIIGNPISYKESKYFLENALSIVSHRAVVGRESLARRRYDANQENITPRVRPLDTDPNICEVEFKPTVAGNRRVSLVAERAGSEEISTITTRIQAGPLEDLQIVMQDPANFSNVYRGDTAKISVKAKDEFGNRIVENNLKFAIFSDSSLVKLLSTDCEVNSEQGSHQLTIRWEKVGKGSFDLIASQGNRKVRKDIPLEVIPPPVSAAKSYIVQNDLDKIEKTIHEAGQPITFKLKLIDIFGNAISYEESKWFVKSIYVAVPEKRHNANLSASLKFRPLDTDPNICEVEFTPTVAGNRRVSLVAVRGREKISTITTRVQAGPLEELQIVMQDPANFSNVYRGDTAKISVKAKDEFGNIIVENNLKFAIFSDSSLVKLLSTDCRGDSEEGSHQLTIRWEKVGKGSFDLVASQGNRQRMKDIPLEVIPPPVSAANSYIVQNDLDEIEKTIHEAGQAIRFQLKLIDIFGNAISYEESKSFVASICLADPEKRHNANLSASLKFRPLDVDPNICEVEFTPTVAGKRLVSLVAERGREEISTITTRIQAGPLEDLQIVMQDPATFSNVYRGDTAKISLKAKDEFGNRIVENNLKFAIFSDSSLVKLLSTDFRGNSEKGSHQLTLRWEKVGKGSFDLIASQGNREVRKDIPLRVIPPPVSAAKSYIVQNDLDEIEKTIHEAGQAITFKLKLIDVFGNAISYEESRCFVKSLYLAVPEKRYNANLSASLKFRPLDTDPNICEVEFKPTVAGNRRVSLVAERGSEKISTITTRVQAGPLKELQIVMQDPTYFRKVYRGDTAKISVKAKDEFGNRIGVENNLKFAIFSDSSLVKLLSTDCEVNSEQGSHQLKIRWEKVGKGSFDLIASQGNREVRKDIPLEVIPPPVSAAKSYIVQNDLDEIEKTIHEAGQAITFKLKLIDIFGNAISYEESKSFVKRICLAFHDTSQTPGGSSRVRSAGEQESFKTNPSDVDSNACELMVTPYMAGKRVLLLTLNEQDKEDKKSPLRFAVKPGPLAEIEIVSHEPTASKQNILSSYSKQQRTLVLKGKDEFGNEVPMDPGEWYLDASGDLEEESKLITEENFLAFQYTFDKPGTYEVDVKPKKHLPKLAKLPYFEVEIVKVPLDVSKCVCSCADEKPIFAGEPENSFSIRMSLFDRIGNRYSITADSEFRTELLSVKIDDQSANVVAHEIGTEKGEIYVKTVLDKKSVGTKDVQVIYNGEPLGEKLSVNIVGLQPYRTENFVRLYQNKKVICCKDVSRGMLADDATLDNINRIVKNPSDEKIKLRRSDINDNTNNTEMKLIDVVLKKFDSETLSDFLEIISLFVEGAHHYRNQANEFDREREKWKAKSMEAYFSHKHDESKACSVIKEKFATLMNQCHRRASDAIFEFYNRGRPQSEIDLHGQLVADSKKMKEYKEQLLNKKEKSAVEVDAIIERERKERNEAIRKLDERLSNFDHEKAKRDGDDWLEIIDGAGHHSARRGEQKIRPKVKENLEEKKIKYVEANEGALLITFSPYTGTEPCFANFYCTRCKNAWPSASSWNGFYQRCFNCYRKRGVYSECYPFKLRGLRRKRQKSRDSNRMSREDHRRLCQKCIELGRDCKAQ